MKQLSEEDKQLLLKDLSSRLPYGVIIEYNNDGCSSTRELGLDSLHDFMFDNAELKPYLRPIPSMTEEERGELRKFCRKEEGILYDIGVSGAINAPAIIDYLNAHHFDFRGLLEKGLALEAPEGMYETK